LKDNVRAYQRPGTAYLQVGNTIVVWQAVTLAEIRQYASPGPAQSAERDINKQVLSAALDAIGIGQELQPLVAAFSALQTATAAALERAARSFLDNLSNTSALANKNTLFWVGIQYRVGNGTPFVGGPGGLFGFQKDLQVGGIDGYYYWWLLPTR
jgi:hypothetical protein